MRHLSLLLVFIATCWSHDKPDALNPSFTSSYNLLELPPEIIHEIGSWLDYSKQQEIRLVSKRSKELFKGRGKVIRIISAIEKHSLEKHPLELIKGLLEANSEVSGINFGYNDCWLGQLNTSLSAMSFLKELKFGSLQFTAENMTTIASITSLETLRIDHLDSPGYPHSLSPIDFLGSLTTLPNLTGLHLMSTTFPQHSELRNLENIITLLKNIKNLQRLSLTLSGTLSDNTGYNLLLHELEKFPFLTELNLSLDSNSFDIRYVPCLPNLKKFSTTSLGTSLPINIDSIMSNLNLLDLYLARAYFYHPIALENLSNLTALNLSYSNIGSHDQEFEGVCKLPNLIQLDLSFCGYIDTEKFTHLKRLTKLQDLNLEETEIDEAGIQAISTIISMKKLNLADCKEISGYDELQYLGNLTALQTLQIDRQGIGHLTLHAIGFSLRNLIKLSIWDDKNYTLNQHPYKLSNKDSEAFKNFQYLINLQYLIIQNVSFEDEIVEIISKLSQLQHLNLSSCENISVDGFNHFRNTPNLKFLKLQGFKADETCFDILSTHPNLRTLSISAAPQVTKAFLSAIKSLYPNLILPLNMED